MHNSICFICRWFSSVLVLLSIPTWASSSPAINHLLLSDSGKIRLVRTFAKSSLQSQGQAVVFDGYIWFSAADEEHGQELWRSDGTTQGTLLAADINPGPQGSYPMSLTVHGNALYFVAQDSTNGAELRKTYRDGSTGNYRTVLVKDIHSAAEDGIKLGTPLVIFRNKLFFPADDGANGTEIWMSDGTKPGTIRVTDIAAGAADASPRFLSVLKIPLSLSGDILVFSANDGADGRELWKLYWNRVSSVFVTVQIADINPGANHSYPSPLAGTSFTPFGNELYFSATDGPHGEELWKTNGSTAAMVKDIGNASADGIMLNNLGTAVFDNELFFAASASGDSVDLWKTDGTEAGTVQAFDPNYTGVLTFIDFVHGDSLYFSLAPDTPQSGSQPELYRRYWDQNSLSWRSVVVDNIAAYPNGIIWDTRFSAEVDNQLYFSGFGEAPSSGGVFIFSEKGTLSKITRGKQICKENTPRSYLHYNRMILFLADDGDKTMLLKYVP